MGTKEYIDLGMMGGVMLHVERVASVKLRSYMFSEGVGSSGLSSILH